MTNWREKGILVKFDQQEFISLSEDDVKAGFTLADIWSNAQMGRYGYIYYPEQCINDMESCNAAPKEFTGRRLKSNTKCHL